MVRFKVKANSQGQYYLPKEVREELGNKLELICNAKAAIIFPEGLQLETVLQSLKVIRTDLHHRRELQEREAEQER